jgi:hypothetical protein
MELWVGCVAGALEEKEYENMLVKAGFESIDIEPTRIYRMEDARAFLEGTGLDADALSAEVDGRIMSSFVRATKPVESKCCGPDCCS